MAIINDVKEVLHRIRVKRYPAAPDSLGVSHLLELLIVL